MTISAIPPPRASELLAPLLASLPAASISPQPPTALLPLLSPILRQRVQLLSASSAEPWLPLLCYDSTRTPRLAQLVRDERFEPHPVSGDVEIDWEAEVQTSYRRVDEETLQSRVTLPELGILVQLVWCVNDEVGGGDGWRIGEVATCSSEPSSTTSWGQCSIPLAEEAFTRSTTTASTSHPTLTSHNRWNGTGTLLTPESEPEPEVEVESQSQFPSRHPPPEQEEDDDDSYWAQYDNTPARTPLPKHHSPAPPSLFRSTSILETDMQAHTDDADEDSYFAQYASVQPALDSHDPDEEAALKNGDIESTLGKEEIAHGLTIKKGGSINTSQHPDTDTDNHSPKPWSLLSSHQTQTHTQTHSQTTSSSLLPSPTTSPILHPRPSSSTSSTSSTTIAKLEHKAQIREQSEVGIRQHISTSLKSLYRLARVAGIERGEFERIVGREVEVLGMLDGDE